MLLVLPQWHLHHNSALNGSVASVDIGVVSVWESGLKGEGVTISIIDDGVQISHPDLQDGLRREQAKERERTVRGRGERE
jgi:subtilisin family serine protease